MSLAWAQTSRPVCDSAAQLHVAVGMAAVVRELRLCMGCTTQAVLAWHPNLLGDRHVVEEQMTCTQAGNVSTTWLKHTST